MVGIDVVRAAGQGEFGVAKSGAAAPRYDVPAGVQITGPYKPEFAEILTRDALEFVAELAREFTPRVDEILERRRAIQAEFDAGAVPHFLEETAAIRAGDWRVAELPADFRDRRVEITGPTDRKMVINALNSGASVYMPDFEDSNCPTWDNMVRGQVNLRDAVRRTIEYVDPRTGKEYALREQVAVLTVRPRGWHLWESHVRVDGRLVPGGIFDFALFFYHNAAELLARGSGPYFYLPKMQHHLEARVWNDVFVAAQERAHVPRGSVRATCLIETLPAAFQMDEILYELREHAAGLNCGRWDYIFSFIKTLRYDASRVMPDRSVITMTMPFMRAYTQLVIRTCHRRGAHAIGGMSASIPIKGDTAANDAVMAQVRADKLREVRDGHDGSWVAHPGLIPIARAVFDEHMPQPNQIDSAPRDDVVVTAEELLVVPSGRRTLAEARTNINVCIGYMAAWLGGNGCVPLHNLMEDAATAEISRAQVWQWVRHAAVMDDGKPLTRDTVRRLVDEEMQGVRAALGAERFVQGEYLDAAFLTKLMTCGDELHDFLTLPAQDILISMGN